MSLMTVTPAVSPFANDPFYALGLADAYDEHQNGTPIDVLKARAAELLDAEYPKTKHVQPAELYRIGYATGIAGILNSHIATVNSQAEVAQTWRARKQGRQTSTRQHATR
jgi:hypothetical protein